MNMQMLTVCKNTAFLNRLIREGAIRYEGTLSEVSLAHNTQLRER